MMRMIFDWSLWYAPSCRCVNFANACVNSFVFFLVVIVAKDLSLSLLIASFLLWSLSSSKHDFPEVVRNLHYIAESIFNFPALFGFLQCLVFRIDVVNTYQLLCIVELWSAQCYFSFAGISSTFLTKFLATCARAWTLLGSSSISSRTTCNLEGNYYATE